MKRTIFITGACGFIGHHLAMALLKRGDAVFGCDNLNNYYSVRLKELRSSILKKHGGIIFKGDITDLAFLKNSIDQAQPTHVVHLAAQAGVRYSLENPQSYVQSNLVGFVQLLEVIKEQPSTPFIYASSSSVYGANTTLPFQEDDRTDHPKNLYGATKKANESIAWSYHHLFGIPMYALRFFTVYGPLGRPDMAYYQFSDAIMQEKPITLFVHPDDLSCLQRDFTYIDDIVAGTMAAIDRSSSPSIHRVYNLGHSKPERVIDLIYLLEKNLKKRARIHYQPLPQGDVEQTFASIKRSQQELGFNPTISLEDGLQRFCQWFCEYTHSR